MEPSVQKAMNRGGIADITTTGRKTGNPSRIEIYFHQFDGDYYLTGQPRGPRDWNANILANPEFTLHLKKGLTADVSVVGESESDRGERERIIRRAQVENWDYDSEKVEAGIHKWVDSAPFIRFRPI
jgi:deazaflavin-dependent oxidoreductase (nitroreductase family)